MGNLTGTNANAEKAGRAVVKTVLLSAGSGGAATLTLYDYNDPNGNARLILNAAVSTETQLSFEGLDFPSGILAVPSANAALYVIEYG